VCVIREPQNTKPWFLRGQALGTNENDYTQYDRKNGFFHKASSTNFLKLLYWKGIFLSIQN
jgi:hypothetical protein